MLIRTKKLFSGLLALLLAGAATATDEADTAASDPRNIFPSVDSLDGSGIIRDREDYLQERGWVLGFHDDNPGGAYIGWGEATIAVAADHLRYGEARISAFQQAIANATGEFALSRGRAVTQERFVQITRDPEALNRLREPTNAQFLRAIQDRLRSLATAELDRALTELGVDTRGLAQLDHTQRAQLALDSISRELTRSAVETFQGIRLLSTFEESGAVGVLIIYSEGTRRLAENIVRGNLVAIGRGSPSDALDQLNGSLSAEDLLLMHGVRLLRDGNGNPVIVAFGQAAPAITRNDSRQRINMAMSAAERNASMRADGALAEFLNVFAQIDETTVDGIAQSITGEVRGDRSVEIDSVNFVERMNSELRQLSEFDLSGIVRVRTWRANHPDTGHPYVGVVHLWSPTTEVLFSDQPEQEDNSALEEGETPAVRRRRSPEFGREDW